ncbi:bifunctional transcriptional activator/DNA repair enzyme AdaA [Acinetobacter sp. WCHAc060025]|uniref:bifunctional transcriptional activator/DNA repair enzyme AdaA n=1 Tax=Acinetobacter sp. WCHAc060025 TaxID=2518625 RepID=UPI00102362E0|nr:methylated-DNA--[protein]-cysteine S-methyltransferase [Acinetobacter sp. WCHAc060025]RZG72871.1 methylated-DNA--[protein]-cysteine S-methyltransferase [Acinetobacter sp. WCHAc060025]
MQAQIQFERITKAIEYIQNNFKDQPNLDEVAEHLHLSPAHFQRLFTEWAGTSPKKFLQYISLTHAKNILKQDRSVFDATFETGLSSTSRLHELFVQIEGMTPTEYKNGGENLKINYQCTDTRFGRVLIASTSKGICKMSFIEADIEALNELVEQFPKAQFIWQSDELQENALSIFSLENVDLPQIKLHLKGTDFQLKVWECLLKIPMGQLSSYGEIAKHIDAPKASRTVGTAIGANPVAFLIPCHRVIQATGVLGEYHWGKVRKTAMIGWEAGHCHEPV